MTTLVTGGNGWLPSHVVRRLARRGELVVSFDLMEPDELLREMLGDAVARVVFERGDVTDRAALAEAAARHSVTNIVHASAITPRFDREQREPARIIEVNLGGTVNALEVARTLPEFRRFVQISSGAVFGETPGVAVLDETAPANSMNLYGITKLAGERVALRYAALFGLDVVAVRPSNVYGPMERPTPGYAGATQLREMLRVYAAGQPILVNTLDGPYLDWTFAEDVAEGIERAWAIDVLPHRLYLLSGERQFSIGDVLRLWSELLPDLQYRLVPETEANVAFVDEPRGPRPSSARARTDLGWQAATPPEIGMRAYLDWIIRHGPQ